jgi:hypothetical protein
MNKAPKKLMEDPVFKDNFDWFQFSTYVKSEVSRLIKPFEDTLAKRHVEATERYNHINDVNKRLDTIEAYHRLVDSGAVTAPTQFDILEEKIVKDRVELREDQSTFNSQMKRMLDITDKL